VYLIVDGSKEMKRLQLICLMVFLWSSVKTYACSPWSALQITNYEIVGTTLFINITSHTGWQCCYTARVEVVCNSQNFTGNFNNISQQICKGSGSGSFSSWSTPVPYPVMSIDVSQYCPGTELKFRAREFGPDGTGPISATFNVTVPGSIDPLNAIATGDPLVICPGDCVELSGTAENNCGNLSYSWSNGANGATTTVCPNQTTTYTLTATDSGDACGPRTATDQVTVVVDANLEPGVAAISPGSICAGEFVTLTLSNSVGNIQWQSSSSSTGPWVDITGANTEVHLFGPVLSTMYFRAEVSNCIDEDFSNVIEVQVIPGPIADFSFNSVCLGSPVNFTDLSTVIGGGQIDFWNWDFGDGNVSNQQNPSHNYNAPGSYNVSLIVGNNIGCNDTTEIEVLITNTPVADFDYNASCVNGTSVDFTDLSTVDAPADIIGWQWDIGSNGVVDFNSQNPSQSFAQGGLFNVTLTVTATGGCTNSITQQIAVPNIPVPNFSATNVCLGATNNFTDLSQVSGGSISSWNWNFGDGNTSAVQNPSHTYESAGTFNVILTVVSSFGCSETHTATVDVFPQPIADFVGSELAGCAPICPELVSTSQLAGNGSIVDYTWTLSNGMTQSGPNPNYNFCLENNSSQTIVVGVTLIVTSNNGCVDQYTEPNYISVYHNPIADYALTPPVTTITSPVINYQNSSLYASSYQWDFYAQGTSTSHSPTITYPEEPGSYLSQLIVFTPQGCSDTITAIVVVKDEIIFYVPNSFTPDKDDFNEVFLPIFTTGFDPYDYHLSIYNRWGEVIFESYNHRHGWDGTYGESSTRPVKDGTYVWKIEFKETMSDKRHTHTGHVTLLR
jgi:gliding motility-associated-like protein